jgi:3-oxoacyl-[acyl-carrier-protein] synthase-3
LPEQVVTNDDLAQVIDTSDEWIRSRTGIAERRRRGPDQATSDLALAAGKQALEAAGLDPDQIDLIVVATMTPDHSIPSTAALVQRGLGASNAGGYDLGSACSGFVHAFNVGANYVKTGLADNVLVIGAETMSTVTNPTDRATAVIFADGAGAAVLQPAEDGPDLLAIKHGLKGDDDVLVVPASGSRTPPSAETIAAGLGYIHMKGRETFKFAVKTFASLIKDTCAKAEISVDDLTIVVPHQVNQRILEPAADRAGISLDRCKINIERVGNTSAASVAIALDEAVREGRIKSGDLVLMVAFGAGLSWASALVRW